jgi:hypothetical protein
VHFDSCTIAHVDAPVAVISSLHLDGRVLVLPDSESDLSDEHAAALASEGVSEGSVRTALAHLHERSGGNHMLDPRLPIR